jgi:hypothetical protein
MRFLERRPLVTTFLFSSAIILSVFVVQTWMTDRFGAVDGKAPITDPPG